MRFGRAYLMAQDRKVEQLMEMRLKGRMARGRPRIEWEDIIGRIYQ